MAIPTRSDLRRQMLVCRKCNWRGLGRSIVLPVDDVVNCPACNEPLYHADYQGALTSDRAIEVGEDVCLIDGFDAVVVDRCYVGLRILRYGVSVSSENCENYSVLWVEPDQLTPEVNP